MFAPSYSRVYRESPTIDAKHGNRFLQPTSRHLVRTFSAVCWLFRFAGAFFGWLERLLLICGSRTKRERTHPTNKLTTPGGRPRDTRWSPSIRQLSACPLKATRSSENTTRLSASESAT